MVATIYDQTLHQSRIIQITEQTIETDSYLWGIHTITQAYTAQQVVSFLLKITVLDEFITVYFGFDRMASKD
jgi:hypothetical protein